MEMDRAIFVMEMQRLFSAFGKKESTEIGQAYYEALKFSGIKSLGYAITRSIQDDAHFPKVPRLIEFMNLYDRQNGEEETEARWFSFECGKCGDRFSVCKDHVTPDRNCRCLAGHTFDGGDMRYAMEQAILNRQLSAII